MPVGSVVQHEDPSPSGRCSPSGGRNCDRTATRNQPQFVLQPAQDAFARRFPELRSGAEDLLDRPRTRTARAPRGGRRSRRPVQALPIMQELASRFRIASGLWRLTENKRLVLVASVDSDLATRLHMTLGQRLPMLIGAIGRCVAAHSTLSEEQLKEGFAQLRSGKSSVVCSVQEGSCCGADVGMGDRRRRLHARPHYHRSARPGSARRCEVLRCEYPVPGPVREG